MEPIHAEYFHSGGATTLSFIVKRANEKPPGTHCAARRGDEVADELVQSTVCRTTVHPRTPRHTVESQYDRRNPIPKGHGLENGTRKGNPRAHVLSSCELVSTDEGRRSGTVTRPLKFG